MAVKLLSSKEAAAKIKKSDSWLAHGRMGKNDARNIPFIKIGRHVFYTPEDIEVYLRSNRKKAA